MRLSAVYIGIVGTWLTALTLADAVGSNEDTPMASAASVY